MRLLVLDHFFAHDIAALRDALAPGDELRTIRYDALRDEALRILPREVTSGLEPYMRPELEPQRRAWAGRLRTIVEDEFAAFAFDAFVLPSDLFFYVRDLPAVCHRVGATCFVVQKETTIAPTTMEEHTQAVRRWAPPIADAMTVCSERQREFWRRSGGDEARIVVTGQPRFDLYRSASAAEAPADGVPTVLFFSYHLDAYHPSGNAGVEGTPVWQELHEATERGLWELARRGWRVVVKPHPQQPFEDALERMRGALGAGVAERVRFAGGGEDARRLILDADVVVGFQTTGLIESLAARRPVVYTGWDPEAQRLESDLIPFHRWDDVLTVVEDAAAFPDAVAAARTATYDAERGSRADAIVTEYLGPIDGRASERALTVVREHAERAAAERSPEVRRRRAALRTRRAPRQLRRAARRGRRIGETVTRRDRP